MKIKFIKSSNIYDISNKNLQTVSGLINNFLDCSDNEEVNLNLFENSFKLIYDGLENTDLTFLEEDDILEMYNGLKYFLVSDLFISDFKKKACKNKSLIKKVQKEVENLFIEYLDDDDIKENIKKYDTKISLSNPNISFEFIEKFIKETELPINWKSICKNPNIPVEFFEKMIKEGRDIICDALFENLSFEFIEKMLKEGKDINWWGLCSNPNIPVEFFEKAIKEGRDISWYRLCENPNIPLEFFEKAIKEGRRIRLALCRNPNIPVEFFEKIEEYRRCGINFLEKKINEVGPDKFLYWWDDLNENPNLPFEFFEKYINFFSDLSLERLIANPNTPEYFIEKILSKKKYISCENYRDLSLNKALSFDFLFRLLKKYSEDDNNSMNFRCNSTLYCLNDKASTNYFLALIELERRKGDIYTPAFYQLINMPLSFFKKNDKKVYAFPNKNIIDITIMEDILN